MTTKALALTGLLGLAAVAGCTSYVKTYDGNGNLLGACKHGVTLFGIPMGAGIGGSCSGSANPKDQK